ncbi:MAG: peptidylprolyl isomerase, partial [Sphingomonadaceae bacterium]
APDRQGSARQVVIQLIPFPFSQGWVDNVRTLARSHWYDGTAITRVQDNYVVQWGDPHGDEAERAKPVPDGLITVPETCYTITLDVTPCTFPEFASDQSTQEMARAAADALNEEKRDVARKASTPSPSSPSPDVKNTQTRNAPEGWHQRDPYVSWVEFYKGWPIASDTVEYDDQFAQFWPVHCYGMVGVGRGYSPDTGTGAELYTVIGHAPRHLDRNIALVGRVVMGMEHLTSLPRGTGPLGFYEDEAQHVPILSIRLASDLPEAEQPRLQFLSSNSESFDAYMDARANRRDAFFNHSAGGIDICNAPPPIRQAQ